MGALAERTHTHAHRPEPRIRYDARRALRIDRGDVGVALQPQIATAMGSRLGHDFSRVRVHTGPAAADSAGQLGARAYTSGAHIAFSTGSYAPQTSAGARLLAHELGHVAEQAADQDAARGQIVQRDDASTETPPPPSLHIPIGSSRLSLFPGDGPLRLAGMRLPLPGSLRATNALGAGPGPTFVADLDPRGLFVHLLDSIDLQTSTLAGTPPGLENDPAHQSRLQLVNPSMGLDFRSGRIWGLATLHVPSSYPPSLHPGTNVDVRVESSALNPLRWTASASYGPLVANATIRLHYDTSRLASALGTGPRSLATEATHPGFTASGTLGLNIGSRARLPLSYFSAEAATTVPRARPLLGAPTDFPSSYFAGGIIVAPPGSLFSVPAPALGATGARFGERSGVSGTVALAPTLSPEAISRGDPWHQEFPLYGFAEVSYVNRVSDGLELGIRAIAQVNTAELVRPPRGLPAPTPGAPRLTDPGDPRHPALPELPAPISPYVGVTIFGRFNTPYF